VEAARYERRFAVGFFDGGENMTRKRKLIIDDDTKIRTAGDLWQLVNSNSVQTRKRSLGIRYGKNRAFRNRDR